MVEPSGCVARSRATRVAVVGGGFAGLLAARSLAATGISATVYEARDQVGGRVRSDLRFAPGRVTEVGAELIGSIHTRWVSLAATYGIGLTARMSTELYDGQQLRMPLVLDRALTMPEIRALEAELTTRVLLPLSRLATMITDPARPWEQPRLAPLDAMSVAQMLIHLGVARGSRLWSMTRLLLENDNVAPLERLNLLGLLCQVRGGQSGTIATDPVGKLLGYWNELEIYKADQGSQALAHAVAREVAARRGSQVLLRRAVTAIDIGRSSVRVTASAVLGRQRGPASSEQYDYVVFAIPPTVWAGVTVTPVSPTAAVGLMRSGPAVKLFNRVDRRFWLDDRLAPSGGSLALGQVWEGTENQTLAPGQPAVLSAYAGGRPTNARDMITELDRLYPKRAANTRQTLYADWPHEPFIMTGFSSPGPGQVFGVGKALNEPFRDRLFFAGEHTQLDHFGYMEGAIRSGERAAAQIIAKVCPVVRSDLRVA